MIEIKNLTKVYDHKGLKALDGVSAKIEAGTLTTIIGPSGAGKSTLLRLINQSQESDSGSITTNIEKEKIVLISQDWKLESELSLEQSVEKVHGDSFKVLYPRFRHLVEVFRLQAKVTKALSQLSMGQKARAYLIKNLVSSPKLLLLDEPFAHLDRFLREEIEEELIEFRQREKLTMVIVSHDLESTLKFSDQILFLSSGRLNFSGTPHDFFHRPPNSLTANFAGGANLIASSVMRVEGEYIVVKNPLGEFRLHQSKVSSEFRAGSRFGYLFCRSNEIRLHLGLKDFKIKSVRFKGSTTDLHLTNSQESLQLCVSLASSPNHEFSEDQETGLTFDAVSWRLLPI
jgi:ABC-type Fe3+/spermidine/putrescine transport system ATPase subunit